MKKYLKRLLSMMMAVLLCFGIVPSNAFAAEYEYDGYISMIDYNGRGYSLSSSLPAPFGGYSTDKFTELRINDLTAFRTAYCIQLGVATHTGIGYDQSDDYAALTMEQKAMINTALTLGYNVETGTKYGGSAMDEYIATQILIWLIAHGQLGTGYENQIVNEITANSPAAKTIFQKLRENVVTYHTVPSFATDNPSAVGAYTHDLKYNEDTGKNETTLVDENNVLKDFSVSYPGVDFSISGNKLHVSTDKKEFGTITAEKELPSSIPGVVTGGTKYWLRDEYQNVVTFDVKGSAEPVKCYFSLEIKAGTLQLVKTSEDGEVSGIPFHISGNGIEKDVVTGPDGSIRVDNLQAGTYTVTERAPDKYVQPESKQVTIYPGQTSSVSFSNLLKKFTVKLDKVDSETEEAQGDSSLDGALYGMFKGENLLDTYTTANGGKFTTKEYPCGSDYTIREITPSEGYLLDETIYPVGAEPGNFTLENNSIPMTATEDVILGSIAITKHTDKPAESSDSDQIEQPEEGAQFQIYLASAGSYENAKETERDLLTTDSYGFARSKDLPYGLYVVHQTKGAQGQKFVPDFSVFISEHGKTYYFILNNPTFTSLIRFEKKDAESGKIIPLAGTAVKIRNADTGEWVVQHINYPSPIDIDTFVTDSTGTLMLPEPLPFGNYELYEQQSPWGYVLDKEPVPFVVDGSQDVVTVEKYNIPQKGTITVSKEGEVFKSVAESGGMYQPQYEVQGQPGAVYEITALEDVVTPDGTVHLKAGELAATLTTGSDGTATSEPLYLGRYQVKEITAPDGMVIDPEPKEVVLSYAGQEVEITSASIGFVNERQKVEISLKKLLEQDETFSLGMNEEWKNITFGLFAAEQLTASDGTSIPADGLMETIGIDENGNAVFTTDIPCGASLYVQEIGTDDHYILSDKKSPVVFEYILTNERYIGDELFQKRYTTDTLPFQKKINRGQKKQYYAEDTHDPIISREVFRKAQELLKRKSERHGHQNNGQYTFTSLIVCDECGTNFCRRIAKNQRVLWTCRKHFKGKHLCSMESLNETEIQQCFLTLYKKLAENRQEILGSYLRQLEELKDKDFMAHPDAMELNRQIAGLLEQNHTLHRLRAKECIDSAFFIAQSNELSQKISNLKAELKQYRDLNEYADFIDNTRLILTILDSPMPVFSSSVFRNIVSRITVTHETLRFQLVNGLELEEERISGG